MKITKVRIDDIFPYEGNAKLHPTEQIAQIKESIREFGNNDPIAIDENHVIIEGHGRWLALKELGYEEAECIILKDLTEDQKKAYRIVHNQLTMNSGFDFDLLKEELENISLDLDKYDLNLDALGDDLLDEKEAEDDDFDVDGALEEAEKRSRNAAICTGLATTSSFAGTAPRKRTSKGLCKARKPTWFSPIRRGT